MPPSSPLNTTAAAALLPCTAQVLIRRELEEAAKVLGERVRAGEATSEVRALCCARCPPCAARLLAWVLIECGTPGVPAGGAPQVAGVWVARCGRVGAWKVLDERKWRRVWVLVRAYMVML